MPRKSSPRAMSIPLLFGTIAVSYISGTILPIVAETRPVNVSAILVMSILVVSADFVQAEDCVVALV